MKSGINRLTFSWLVLLVLTVAGAFIAERVEISALIVILVCSTIVMKGVMVIEHLMGLRSALLGIRWAMLSYFFILPSMIALSVLFPEVLAGLTSL